MEMQPWVLWLITLGSMLIFMFLSIPIAFSLFFAGVLGTLIAEGPQMLMSLGSTSWRLTFNYGILAVPLFISMGNILLEHDIGADLYDTTYKWIGWVKGGLAIASTYFCAIFGFMCGATVAACVTVGGVAIPEMEKRHYNRRLALGTLASAGTLAQLIPPSGLMILYAITTEASMGSLFIAGIIPGVLLATLMAAYIFTICTIKPNLGPAGEKFGWGARFAALIHLAPAAILVMAVLGTIYLGVASAIEAGAMGATISVIIAASMRRLTWDKMKKALTHTAKTAGFIYMIIIGANVFVYCLYLTGFQQAVQDFMIGLNVSGWMTVVIMGLILTVLGTFMDPVAIIFVAAPIFLPVAQAAGFDIIWFGIVIIIFCEMAQITPPVGVALFVIQGIAPKDTKLSDVAIGAAPYVMLIWVLFALLIAFPGLALWLPGTMKH